MKINLSFPLLLFAFSLACGGQNHPFLDQNQITDIHAEGLVFRKAAIGQVIAACTLSGALGALWFWWDPQGWFLGPVQGCIWGLLVAFGMWGTQAAWMKQMREIKLKVLRLLQKFITNV